MNSNFTEDAKNILAQYADASLPIRVIEIANQRGIDVLLDSEYPNSMSGHADINANGKAQIIINEKQSYGRKRFTIAHELAHCIMDLDYIKEHGSIDRDGKELDETYRKREKTANDFAAELLMPEAVFLNQYKILNGDIEKIATNFGVSTQAAQIRTFSLGLLNWHESV